MSGEPGDDADYSDTDIASLELIWGDGYLSPGGPEEISRILAGVNLEGLDVLDFGCGTGGIDVLLARQFDARRVFGVDVQASMIDRARTRAEAQGLDDRISFHRVDPGPLPFEPGTFDVVFTKGTLIHIEDKDSFFSDAYRVLRGGGLIIGDDWLQGQKLSDRAALERFIALSGHDFAMATSDEMRGMLEAAGFIDVSLNDRNRWYGEEARRELERMEGPLRQERIGAIGLDAHEEEAEFWRAMLKVLDAGDLRPTHIRAFKR